MNVRRKICVATGARAEYGLLYWLMKEIEGDYELQLQIVATGMHLSPEFGLTYRQIEADGFCIDAKVEMLISSDSPVGVVKSMGLGVIGFADALHRLAPDILVILGDRFEMLTAAQAALVLRIPIAHIHGGEVTEGAFDESIRHALTKMAQWHFVAAEVYRKRVVQLGEAPERVYNFGAPGLDHIQYLKWVDRKSLEDVLEMELRDPLFLVTYHPATLDLRKPVASLNELLAALERFPEATIVFTFPNADTGARALINRIAEWVKENTLRAKGFISLGQINYLSLMRESDVIIGNSSSGITEAPALRKATVNIGKRQAGRLRSRSVIDVPEERNLIVNAIKEALTEEFRSSLQYVESPYGAGNVSHRIKEVLKTVSALTQKPFFDIAHEH